MASDRPPTTLRDVARMAGVSPATVSNVMQNHPRVATQTRQRVLDAARVLQYEPNRLAQSLRSGRTGTVALITPSLRNSYFAEIASEIITAAREYDLRVSVEVLDGDRRQEESLLTGSWTSFADGIFYIPQDLAGREIDYVLDARTGRRPPVILLGERGAGSDCAKVTYRNADASRAAVQALINRGATRIASIGPHERSGSATPRFEGYVRALRDEGLTMDPRLIRDTSTWHRAAGTDAVRALLSEGAEFDAIFAFNDMIALGALSALASAGVRVPQDVQIVGFDDVEEAAYSVPALTTVDPGKADAARLALRLLDHLLRGETPPEGTSLAPAYEVIVRGTTLSPSTSSSLTTSLEISA